MSEIERAIEIREAIDFCRYLESGQTDEVEVHYIPTGTILPILESELLREQCCIFCAGDNPNKVTGQYGNRFCVNCGRNMMKESEK